MASHRTLERVVLALAVGVAAAGVLFGLHYYIALRIVFDPRMPEPWFGVSIALLWCLGLSLVAQPLAERLVRPSLARIVAWPASLWMGFAFLLVVALSTADLVVWLGGAVARAASDAPMGGSGAAASQAWGCAGVALLLGAAGLRIGLRAPVLRRVEIALERWPDALDGYRIVQLSDVHIGSLLRRDFARQIVERVNALQPDVVAITGDLVDGSVQKLAEEVAPFGELRARHGVFFVTGNHDHYSGARAWTAKIAELGIRVLRNERVEISDGGARFDLVGVDDHRSGQLGAGGGEDLDAALAGRDAGRPAVLLAHDPSTFKRASASGIDLQISGHTHGGQIWPFDYLVRAAIPFVAGRYRRGGAELYVSRGTGFWGPPMRLFAPAEITEIVLRRRRLDLH